MKKKLLIISILYTVLVVAFGVFHFLKGDSNYLGYKKQIQLAEKKLASKPKENNVSQATSVGKTINTNSTGTSTAVDNKTQTVSTSNVVPAPTDKPATAKEEDYSNISFTRTLQKGAPQGNDIKKLQYILIKKGTYTKEINGNFDDDTLEAVKKFQKSVNLPSDGVVGPGTQKKLLE